MPLALELLPSSHEIARSDGLNFNTRTTSFELGQSFPMDNADFAASRCVIAHDNGKLVGVFQYWLSSNGVLHSCGTWVHVRYRDRGISTDLWTIGLRASRAKRVSVTVVSDGGKTLVESLERRFPDVKWQIVEDSWRYTRNLRKLKRRSY